MRSIVVNTFALIGVLTVMVLVIGWLSKFKFKNKGQEGALQCLIMIVCFLIAVKIVF